TSFTHLLLGPLEHVSRDAERDLRRGHTFIVPPQDAIVNAAGALPLHEAEAFAAFIDVASHRAAVRITAMEDLLRERILDGLQDRALQRTRAESRLVADVDEPHLGGLREVESQLAIGHELLQSTQLDVDNATEVLLRERTENDDIVDAV